MMFFVLSAMCRHFYSHSYCHCKAIEGQKANKALKVLQSLKNCSGELNCNSVFLRGVCHPLFFSEWFQEPQHLSLPICSVHGAQMSPQNFPRLVLVMPVMWAALIHSRSTPTGFVITHANCGTGE